MVKKIPLLKRYTKAYSRKQHAVSWNTLLHKISTRLPNWLIVCDRIFLLTLPQQDSRRQDSSAWIVAPAHEDDFKKMAICRNMIDSEAGIALFKNRADSGAICYYLAKKTSENEKIEVLGYVWISLTGNLMEDRDRYHITCNDSQGYIFDTYLHPSTRGQGLYAFLLAKTQEAVAGKKNFTWVTMVDQYNIISLKAHHKLGAQVLEGITFSSVLGITHYTLQTKIRKYYYYSNPFASTPLCESLALPPGSSLPPAVVHQGKENG